MSKHTPGPWLYGQDGFSLGNGVVYSRHANGNPKDICSVRGWGADQQANVRLIAAAPDLLEACETYHNLLRSQIRDGRQADAEAHYQAQCKMESAIKKARGEK